MSRYYSGFEQAVISPPISEATFKIHDESEPVRLGVLASGTGSNFQAIADAIAQNRLNATIQTLIYNNPGAAVARRAEALNIPSILLNHREFDRREDFDQAIVKSLIAQAVDWVIMAGWMRRVTSVLVDSFEGRILNIHPSLLPSFPGIRAIEQALEAGVTIAGCTVHHVVLEVDSGPIVMQAAVPIYPDDTAETLHQRIHEQEHRIYPLAIALATSQQSQP
jgi:phosphoribosylglycinamide formyltransferase-1